MEERTTYVCEICRAEYKYPADCRRCESKHIKTSTILEEHYPNRRKYPSKISVTFEDGAIGDYEANYVVSDGKDISEEMTVENKERDYSANYGF